MSWMFFCTVSTNSMDCALEALSTVHVLFSRASNLKSLLSPVAKEKPIRAAFTPKQARAGSSIHRCWYGLSCRTAGSDWRESKGPLTDAVDVIRGDGSPLRELPGRFVGFVVKLLFPYLEIAFQ